LVALKLNHKWPGSVDYTVAADRTFDMLMRDAIAPRKRFIQLHAKAVRTQDI
jgi:DNA gyrase/topoisomerase IV subunit B